MLICSSCFVNKNGALAEIFSIPQISLSQMRCLKQNAPWNRVFEISLFAQRGGGVNDFWDGQGYRQYDHAIRLLPCQGKHSIASSKSLLVSNTGIEYNMNGG